MEQARVLVFSNDRGFVEAMARSWRRLRYSPEFTVAVANGSGEPLRSAVVVTSDVSLLPHLAAAVLAIVVIPEAALPDGPEADGQELAGGMRVLWIQRSAGWSDVAAVLGQGTGARVGPPGEGGGGEQGLRGGRAPSALGGLYSRRGAGLGHHPAQRFGRAAQQRAGGGAAHRGRGAAW